MKRQRTGYKNTTQARPENKNKKTTKQVANGGVLLYEAVRGGTWCLITDNLAPHQCTMNNELPGMNLVRDDGVVVAWGG